MEREGWLKSWQIFDPELENDAGVSHNKCRPVPSFACEKVEIRIFRIQTYR